MLVLSRKIGQKIVIDDNIVVTVVAHKGDAVKLGFEAPREVTIHREEIHRRIQSEQISPNPFSTHDYPLLAQS